MCFYSKNGPRPNPNYLLYTIRNVTLCVEQNVKGLMCILQYDQEKKNVSGICKEYFKKRHLLKPFWVYFYVQRGNHSNERYTGLAISMPRAFALLSFCGLLHR